MITNIIAIYPGRFQPFSRHHAEAFKWLQKQFGAANTYIVTSNVVQLPKSPFSFSDKQDIIRQYNFDDRLVQVKNPYNPQEILTKLDPTKTAVVFMVGKKDMQESPRFSFAAKKDGSPSYFQPYDKNKSNLQGFDKHGYLITAPHISIKTADQEELSGTTVRNLLSKKTSNEERINNFKQVFGWYDPDVAAMVFDRLNAVTEAKLFSKDWWLNELYLDEDCWDGYKQVGMKKKRKKLVPNCVPEQVDASVSEGYMSAKVQAKHNKKIDKLKQFLHSNIGREFVYDFNEFPKTVYGVPIEDLQESLNESKNIKSSISLRTLVEEILGSKNTLDMGYQLLMCGGAGGHMAHPFNIDWVKTGKDLVKVFQMSINYLKKGPAAVKIDGINASIRLITLDNKKTFVIDRGSNKPLDVKGVTKAELMDRFGEGHGMIKIGGTVLDIFNDAIPDITPALKKLGLWDNPNIMLNLEYVAGSSNVLSYNKNFLAVHGLLEIEQVTPKRRGTKEISYSDSAMQELLDKLVPSASKYGYEVVGSIPTKLDGEPNLSAELNKRYTVNYGNGKEETKTLSQWLATCKIPDVNIKTVDGKTIAALSKEVLIKISDGIALDEFIADPKDYQAAINGFVTYMATMKLGDAILEKLSSDLGPVSEHEGIVIRDTNISPNPFKITGKFILGGLATSFGK